MARQRNIQSEGDRVIDTIDDLRETTPLKSNMEGAIDPKHYTELEIEPIDVIEKWNLGFNLGSAIKYIGRCAYSGSKKKDLIKAANYCYREATGRWLPKNLIRDEE